MRDIVFALEDFSDLSNSFLDLETGKVEIVSKEFLRDAEEWDEEDDVNDEGEHLPEGQDSEWEMAKLIMVKAPSRFERLPGRFEVHDWKIMRDFADQFPSARIRADLLDAIHGAGAFRAFKGATRQHGIKQIWFDFREAALRQIAIDWCEEKGICWK